MIEIDDEILDTSGQPDTKPRFRIRNNSGSIIYDDVQVELKTPVVEEGTPINKDLFESIKELKVGDLVSTIAEKTAPWILCDGTAYEKDDYEQLAPYLPWGIYNGGTIKKVGDYYVIHEHTQTFTYYPTLEDAKNNTNGTLVTFSANSNHDISDISYSPYNGGIYAIGCDYGAVYLSTTIGGTYTLYNPHGATTDYYVDRVVGTKYGMYAYTSSSGAERIYFTADYSTWTQLSTDSSGLEAIYKTDDDEYLYVKTYESNTIRTFKGSVANSFTLLGTSNTMKNARYNDAEECFYVLTRSGSSASYVYYLYVINKKIDGTGSGTTLLNQWSTGSIDSRNMISFKGYLFVYMLNSIYVYKNSILIQKIYSGNTPNSEYEFIYSDNVKYANIVFDYDKFSVPYITNEGSYRNYILSER